MARKPKTQRTIVCVHKSTTITNNVDNAKKSFQSEVAGGMTDIECYDITDYKGYSDMLVKENEKKLSEYKSLQRMLSEGGHSLQAKAVELWQTDLKRHKNEGKSIGKVKGR